MVADMEWRTDMSFAPRPGYGEGVQKVLLAIKGSDKMVVSYWLPQDYTNREGGWFSVRPGEEPIAWFPISHPHEKSKAPPPEPVVKTEAPNNVKLPDTPMLPPGIPGITS